MEALPQLVRDPAVVAALQALGLLLARILPLVAFTPIFGGQAVPPRFRFAVGVVLAAGFLAVVCPPDGTVLPLGRYMLLLLKEAVVGFSLALAVLVMFATLTSCGALLDLWRGTTIASVLDPSTQQQESTLGVFFNQLGIALFLTIGGHRVLLAALGDSFVLIHPHALLPARLVGPTSTTAAIGLVADSISVAIRLSAPVFIVTFLLDVGLGLINRLQRQIQVFFLGLELKGVLGILVLLLVLGLLVEGFAGEFVRVLAWLQRFVNG